MISPRLSLILLVLFATTACDNTVSDTEGRAYEYKCASGDCSLTQKPPSAEGDAKKLRIQRESRILSVCDAPDNRSCRPLRCESSRACSALGGREFTCTKDLCQASTRELSGVDRFALCLAETGPWTRSVPQLERTTLASACRPPSCHLPDQCMRP